MCDASNLVKSSDIDMRDIFCGELYQKIIEDKVENFVFSPSSVHSALGLAKFAASGDTLNEMKNGLKFANFYQDTDVALLEFYKNLTGKFKENGFSVANKIYWMDPAFERKVEKVPSFKLHQYLWEKQYYHMKDLEAADWKTHHCENRISQEIKSITWENFRSEIEFLNSERNEKAAKEINSWVSFKTKNHVNNLIRASSINVDTRLVLVNAVHFPGKFCYHFNPAGNFKDQFYLDETNFVEVEYMKITKYLQYADLEELGASGIMLPYIVSYDPHKTISLLIILPNSRTGLSAIENKLNKISFKTLLERMSRANVDLSLPRFNIEFDLNLEEPLKKMGMKKMFSNKAEFRNLFNYNIQKPVKISQVIHRANIEFYEKGSEADSKKEGNRLSTGSQVQPNARNLKFSVNRPFLFALIDGPDILLVGRKVSFPESVSEQNSKKENVAPKNQSAITKKETADKKVEKKPWR